MIKHSAPSTTETLPLLALRGVVWFPWVRSSLFIKSDVNLRTIANAILNRGRFAAIALRDDKLDDHITRKDLFDMGLRASLISTVHLPDGTLKIETSGADRIVPQGEVIESGGSYSIAVTVAPAGTPANPTNYKEILEAVAAQGSALRAILSAEEFESLPTRGEPGYLADLIGSRLSSAPYPTRQAILETIDPWNRLEKASVALRQHASPPLDILEAATAIAEWLGRRLEKAEQAPKS